MGSTRRIARSQVVITGFCGVIFSCTTRRLRSCRSQNRNDLACRRGRARNQPAGPSLFERVSACAPRSRRRGRAARSIGVPCLRRTAMADSTGPLCESITILQMSKQRWLAIATCLAASVVGGGCTRAASSRLHATPPGLGQLPYSDADVEFMSGMIPHHAQAVIMAGWAPTHGARQDVAILCERILVAQRDEIGMMQQWLRDRGLEVPDATSTRHKMKMNGMEQEMLMPGMMSDEQMAALDKARGPEFDRLFLEGMIRHHQGAVDMVDVLFKSYGAAQDETIYKFASDVYADQSIEIDRMHQMLGDRLR